MIARRRTAPGRAAASIAVLLLAGACAGDGPDLCVPVHAGVPVARNGELPAQPGDVTFTELWRVAGVQDGQDLGTPVPPALAPDRRIAVPDFQLAEVYVLGPDGAWLGSVGRRGPGPGEFDTPVAAAFSADGRLHVFDFGKPARITFAPGGAFEAESPIDPALTAPIVMGGELAWAGITSAGHLFVRLGVEATGLDPSRGTEALIVLRAGGTTIDTLLAVPLRLVWGARFRAWPVPGDPRIAFAIGPDGTIALGGYTGYRFVVFDAALQPVLQVCAATPPAPLTPAERGVESPEPMRELAAAIAAAARPDTLASYGRLVVGADGTFWVQRERQPAHPDFAGSMYGEPGATFDVFDRDGAYRTTVRLPPAARLQAVAGDTLWTYETGPLDEISIVAYRAQTLNALSR